METLVEGRAFLEGPRWHAGALYVSDMHAHQVLRVDPAGDVEVLATLDGAPSGLGWLPDGRMLVVSMQDRRLLAADASGSLVETADCSALAAHEINDMILDRHGHAFISQFGYDLHGGAPFAPAALLRADPDGTVRAAAPDLRVANGMVITNDQRTLVVAESAGKVLTGFDLADDGTLANRRIWAELPHHPDGIAIDAQDGVWVAAPVGDCFTRVLEGGAVTDEVAVEGTHAIACAIGGDDGHTLFCCTATTHGEPDESRAARGAKIETTRVDVPAPGF